MSALTSKYGKIEIYLKDGSGRPVPIDLQVSNETITKHIFAGNKKSMDFSVRLPDYSGDLPKYLYLYLGTDPIRRWQNDYSISLKREYDFSNHPYWAAETKDITRIRQEFWCAAKAEITLCDHDQTPLITDTEESASTIIGLGYDAWYEKVYEGVKQGLESINQEADLTSPFEQEVEVGASSDEESPSSEILAVYWRIKSCLDDLGRSVSKIVANPAQRNYAQHSFYSLQGAHSNPLSSGQINCGFITVQSYQTIGGRVVPDNYISTQIEATHNIEENYIALQCIKRVLGYLEDISDEIKKYIEDLRKIKFGIHSGVHKDKLEADIRQHERELKDIKEQVDKFSYYIKRFSFLERDYCPPSLNFSSELLYYDDRYSTVWKILARIDRILNYINTSDEVIKFQVAPFQEVYERWCLLKIVSALEEMGFRKISSASKSPLYGNPRFNSQYCELEHPKDPGLSLKIYFEKKHQFIDSNWPEDSYGFWKPAYEGEPGSEWKHTPDISLEFFRDLGYPHIVTFDPTLGGKSIWSDKYKYKKTIRANTSQGYDYIVKAAWAIAPGQAKHSISPFYSDEDAGFTEGTIFLNHTRGSQEALYVTLSKILMSNGLLSASVE
jgi:hypothetical protein